MTASSTFDPVAFKQTTRSQWQDAAAAWHRWGDFIGQWLGEATETMIDMAGIRSGSTVLDVAAGAGEQTLRIARRVGPTGRVLATDIAPNLLARAASDAAAEGLSQVETRELDGEALDTLDPGSFDAAVSRVGLIYFPDRQRALRGIRSALRTGGRTASVVYSTPAANEFFSIPVGIIRRRAQLPPPVPGQPGPFSLGAPGVLAEALTTAGFTAVEVRTVPSPVRLSSAKECVRFQQESFGALHQMMAGLSAAERADTWREVEEALTRFEGPDGFVGPCEMLVGAGTAGR
jgi:ubiquinone/menaquinone biosynthesis C-methylase UbiE